MRKLAVVLLFTASAAVAQQPQQPHSELFPSDFKQNACGQGISCESFTDVDMVTAAFKFLFRNLDLEWNRAHRAELLTMMQPYCVKRATCMATPGNEWWFCNDVWVQEVRGQCDVKYPVATAATDNEQCHTWIDTYASGVDQRGSADAKKAQECTKREVPASTTLRKLEWWSKPAVIPVQYDKQIQIFTIDRETHVPVQASITVEGQNLFSTESPVGRPTSYYPFPWPRQLHREPNAQGHSDVVAPMMTISAPGYESVNARVPTSVPKMIVSVRPARLKTGVNRVTVSATDEQTGKPVEAQVYYGQQTVGFANQPIEITVPARKRAEIWVRSPYGAYSDAVVIPGK